jgi:radical SAM superfamily enzyme YgiQ (UPF0313 family)
MIYTILTFLFLGKGLKFLFIYPSSGKFEFASDKFGSSKSLLPPIGLLYLASILEQNGYETEIIDLNAEEINKESLRKSVLSSDVIGLTLHSEKRELEISMMITDFIKKISPYTPIIIGGPHCSMVPETALNQHHADICAKGPACHIILSIAEALEGKCELSEIPDICYKLNDKIIHTKISDGLDNLDEIPFPARHLVEKYDYGYMYGVKLSKGKTTSISFSQGCPFHCRFCNLRVHMRSYKSRSITNLTKEIDELISKEYKTIAFVDDNFIVNKKDVEKIMDYFIEKNADISIWILDARIDSADRDLFKKMKKAGVEHIYFGIESGNQDVLDFYNKKISLEQIRNAVNLSNKMNFFTTASFILGAPIETCDHIENTIKFAKSLPLDVSVFYPFGYVYKSDLWKEAVNNGKIESDEQIVLCDSERGLGNFTTKEIMDYTTKAQKNFYMNPKLWMRNFLKGISRGNFNHLKVGLKLIS